MCFQRSFFSIRKFLTLRVVFLGIVAPSTLYPLPETLAIGSLGGIRTPRGLPLAITYISFTILLFYLYIKAMRTISLSRLRAVKLEREWAGEVLEKNILPWLAGI